MSKTSGNGDNWNNSLRVDIVYIKWNRFSRATIAGGVTSSARYLRKTFTFTSSARYPMKKFHPHEFREVPNEKFCPHEFHEVPNEIFHPHEFREVPNEKCHPHEFRNVILAQLTRYVMKNFPIIKNFYFWHGFHTIV